MIPELIFLVGLILGFVIGVIFVVGVYDWKILTEVIL